MATGCNDADRGNGSLRVFLAANLARSFFLGCELVGGIWIATVFLFIAAFQKCLSEGNRFVEGTALRGEGLDDVYGRGRLMSKRNIFIGLAVCALAGSVFSYVRHVPSWGYFLSSCAIVFAALGLRK